MKVRPTYTVTVESLDLEGQGIAHREGKAVFIEGALPGETVTYEVVRDKPRFEKGVMLVTDGASPMRATPACPYFGHKAGFCGGCAMQHVDAKAQVAVKERAMLDALDHIGKVAPEEILPPLEGPVYGYRQRARLSVRDVAKKGTVLVGFHEKSSSYVADILSCVVLPENVSAMLPEFRELVKSLTLHDKIPQIEVARAGEVTALVIRHLEALTDDDLEKIERFATDHDVSFWLQPKGPDSIHPLHEKDATALKLKLPEFGVEIGFRPTDFTQVNHALNEKMVSRAVKLLDLTENDRVVDFFCGLGNFTLPIATKAGKVFGIEGSPALVERAKSGAIENSLQQKADFAARDLFEFKIDDWEALFKVAGGITRVLLDPPREGALAVVKALSVTTNRPERIVYVSCNPATLARDLAILVHEGGWKLEKAGVMNMFPHTGHVESIALLTHSKKI